MGVYHEFNPQPVARGQRLVTVYLPDFGIDQRRHASVGTANQIGLAAARRDLFENHGTPSPLTRNPSMGRTATLLLFARAALGTGA
jgi:hypothetical protein